MAGAAGATMVTTMQAQTEVKQKIVELRYFKLRNTMDNQRAKMAEFLGKTVVPAMKRAGTGPVGLFAASVAPEAPFQMLAVEHASIAAFEECWKKLNADEELVAGARTLMGSVALPFERMEVQLLRGFRGFPAIEVPAGDGARPARLFELRTYESNTPASLMKKIGMFENGEIDLFRKFGLTPVFFGEMLAGPRMPNLTYMVAFDSLSQREAAWRAFGTSPEWKKMAATPGLSDGEVVSNITNMLLTPVAGSMIR